MRFFTYMEIVLLHSVISVLSRNIYSRAVEETGLEIPDTELEKETNPWTVGVYSNSDDEILIAATPAEDSKKPKQDPPKVDKSYSVNSCTKPDVSFSFACFV